jgi:hypothetical protein
VRRATACRATDPRDARQANDTRFDQSTSIANRHEKERSDEPVSMLVALTKAEEAAGQPSAFGRDPPSGVTTAFGRTQYSNHHTITTTYDTHTHKRSTHEPRSHCKRSNH